MPSKVLLKKILNAEKKTDENALLELITDYDYISFDIFDTLLKRNVEAPIDIFSIMEKTAGPGFREKRIKAEIQARKQTSETEITIEDIYSYLPEEERKKLITLELETEMKAIVPNQFIVKAYRKCLDMGKTIYITSDMYWREESIKQLLEKNGFWGYKALYLSSREQKVKRNGSLFRLLLNKEQIRPEQLVHIGDSQKSDYIEPMKLGIKAFKIPRYMKNVEFRGSDRNEKIEVNYLNHFINNTIPCYADPYYQFGYSQFGKLLYGYVHWIHDEAVRRGIRKIFFLARDGYIMKQAYEACINDTSIELKYLEVSRRSLRGPVLWMDCSYETILKMVVNAKMISLISIFDGLGLEINHYSDVIKSCELELCSVFDRSTIKYDERLRKLIEELKPDIIENSRTEYEYLEKYLAENEVTGKFAVVDIGYAGSMQRYLQQVLTQLKIEHEITGFYLAVADFYKKNMLPGVELELNGYLFDFQHNNKAVDTRSSFVGLFETLFLEQSGSVKKYVFNENKVIAERYLYEYVVNGKPTEDMKKIRFIQKGALDFLNRAAEDSILSDLLCRPEEYFYGLHEVGSNPTLNDLQLLGDIQFYDEGVTQKLASPKSIIYYILHPRELKKDFLQCRWKTGFLKRLLKVNLPYQKIYEIMRVKG